MAAAGRKGPALVLATSPVPLEQRYGKFAGAASTEPSFGLLCLGAAAETAGADVRVVEAAAWNLSVDATTRRILEAPPDIVGISSTTVGIVAAGELASSLKSERPSARILIGGCHVTALPERTLNDIPAFDVAVLGEGEETLAEIVRQFKEVGRIPDSLAGTAVRTPEGIRRNPPRPYVRDMDLLPMPAWHLLPGFPHSFRPSPARIRRWPCASIVLTRGCPNRCTFCDRSVFGNVCRHYSAEYAVRMIDELKNAYGVREILIEDDTFVIRKDTVRDFCRLLIDRNVDVSWSCLGRVNLVDPDILSLMHRAGCWHISYGIESGDPDILNSVNKNIGMDQVRRALIWSREAGLRTKGFFMVGFPGETAETLERTRRLIRELPMDDISVMQLTPFPGSDIYDQAACLGSFDPDWRKMNTLNTVFVPSGLETDLETARRGFLRTFYLRPDVLARNFRHMLTHPRTIGDSARALQALLRVMRAKKAK